MLKKSTIREIKTSLARYLAIVSIVALGVGFYAGLQMCRPDMISTAASYLQQHNFYDYQLMSSWGIDDESVELAEKTEGVADAEPAIEQDVVISIDGGDDAVLKAISLPEKINTLQLDEGRLPEAADECVVDKYHPTEAGYSIGDTLKVADSNKKSIKKKFTEKEFKIVGSVSTPLYLDYERGSTTLGNGSLNTFFYVDRDAFDSDYYTQLYIDLEGDEASFSPELDAKLEKFETPMDELAEKITETRRAAVQKEAQETLDEKKQEYEDGVATYEREKADAEKKLRNGQSEINSGKKTIDKNEKKLNSTIKDLKSKKSQITDGIAQAKAKKAELEQAHAAGFIDEATYKAGKAQIDGTLKSLNKNKTKITNGLAQAKAGLATLKDKRAELKKAQNTLNSNKAKAEREFADAKAELDDAKKELDEAQEEIDEMETGNSFSFSREDNLGYSTFDENATIVSNIAKIFPLFFFLVAALVCMTTMTRMIDEQRSQIGILKALGYSNGAVLGKYLFYSGSAAFIGSVAGYFAGCRIFPTVIWHAYTMMYGFNPKVEILYDWKLGVICLIAALACSMGATWVSCASDFRVVPAELIRPKTPKAGKRILLERITPLWKRISFLYKVSFRNVFRYKKRFLMMVLGISGCTALLIAGMGIDTTVKGVARFQYSEVVNYDYQLIFDENMDAKAQQKMLDYAEDKAGDYGDMLFVHSSTVDFVHGQSSTEVTITACDDERINEHMSFHFDGERVAYPGDGEVIICRKLHQQNGVDIGDTVTLRDGFRELTATVSGIYDNYVGETMFMTGRTYKAGFGKEPAIKTAYVMAPDGLDDAVLRQQATDIGQYKHISATAVNQDLIERVDSMMESLNAIVYVVILCAGLLAFIVLYNLTNINITERIREIATIKVLGFNRRETGQYVFRENLFLTAIAAVVGVPLGKWLLNFVVENICVNMIFFVARITWQNYVLAIVLTFAFAFVVNFAMQPRLRNVSMTESLKSIE